MATLRLHGLAIDEQQKDGAGRLKDVVRSQGKVSPLPTSREPNGLVPRSAVPAGLRTFRVVRFWFPEARLRLSLRVGRLNRVLS